MTKNILPDEQKYGKQSANKDKKDKNRSKYKKDQQNGKPPQLH
jgi:hypothetical protein